MRRRLPGWSRNMASTMRRWRRRPRPWRIPGRPADTAADRLAALTGVLGQTQGAYELLAEAQEQQNETGYLELDTQVVKLLEEYPQLSGYLVEASNGYLLAGGALRDTSPPSGPSMPWR